MQASRELAVKNLIYQVRVITEALDGYGVKAVRRDKREPGRTEKEAAEEKLSRLFMRRFRRQAGQIRAKLENYAPDRKELTVPPIELFDDDWMDDEESAELIRQLTKAARGGIALFGQRTGVQIDYTLTNKEAADWARQYAGDLLKKIDETTRQVLQSAITQFVETPGFTIRDVMDLLPFNEDRALSVAVTEITRTYAHGQQQAGEALKEEFPGVRIIKTWFTNNDDLVCDLCGPLDGKEIDVDENFYEPENEYQDGNPPRHVNCRCWIDTNTKITD